MDLKIKELMIYGEYSAEFMKISGVMNDEYEFSVFLEPQENLIINIDVKPICKKDCMNCDIQCEGYGWYEGTKPYLQTKILRYFLDTKNSKLIKILHQAIKAIEHGMWEHITVANSNKHLNYYLDKIYDCFDKNYSDVYEIKEGFTFYLDEHLQD